MMLAHSLPAYPRPYLLICEDLGCGMHHDHVLTYDVPLLSLAAIYSYWHYQ